MAVPPWGARGVPFRARGVLQQPYSVRGGGLRCKARPGPFASRPSGLSRPPLQARGAVHPTGRRVQPYPGSGPGSSAGPSQPPLQTQPGDRRAGRCRTVPGAAAPSGRGRDPRAPPVTSGGGRALPPTTGRAAAGTNQAAAWL